MVNRTTTKFSDLPTIIGIKIVNLIWENVKKSVLFALKAE
ncbi:hypothetical protein RUMHYD_03715 [Blautia hydrogenotrophica DSM 10507]|uniref:Uncharacterized protein n=1 Tax=Blautia hydrogenotrophica (strain DSM 10507 / JCM 14656 / S5a33) TaxID=476272 RepID=C0CS49_BLAHS|nr:hypothetical protein RUMHYD_03715 [Blautia hydrogenotrophica DSM 10507]